MALRLHITTCPTRERPGRDRGDETRRVMTTCTPSQAQAPRLARQHALIPLHRDLLADLLTPVRAYSLLCPPGRPGFLLESVEGGERLARYSFIGFRPEPFALDGRGPLEPLREVVEQAVAATDGLPP